MPKRIRKPPSKKGGNWSHYLKKGAELGALGAVQFVPGLDVAADAVVAGEATEGAEAADAAVTAGQAVGKKLAKKGESKLANYAKSYASQEAQGYLNQMESQPRTPYRGQMAPRYREPPMPSQIGAGYRDPYYPPPKEPLLGPLEKKILMYGVLFIIIGIIVIVIIRTLSHSIDGYYHSSTGCHCKKHNHCGTGKKHNCNGGYGTNNSGHNSCGGS